MTFTIRITAEEYIYLTNKAMNWRISKAEYIRRKVFGDELENEKLD